MYTNNRYPEPGDREEWEPLNPFTWIERDRLSQQFLQRQANSDYNIERIAIQVYAAWIRLPIRLRRQVWREREIAASLYERMETWGIIPGFWAIGVGRRQINGIRRLVGILSTESSLALEAEFREGYDVPYILNVDSIIPAEQDNREIQLVLEYDLAPIQYGVVLADSFVLTSDPSVSPATILTVQSGDEVGGQNQAGFRTPGTLTAIVSYEGTHEPLLLSAGHVFGPVNQAVVAYNAKRAVPIGRVINYNSVLDAAIAELDSPWSVNYQVKGINTIPAPPIMPYCDMPVQIYGNKSGHQLGYLDVVNSIPVGGVLVGVVPHFRATIGSQPGDSGALLLSGHGNQPMISGSFSKYSSAQYLDNLVCSILGLLVAGPSSYTSSCLNYGQILITRPQTYFTPIIQVLEHFKLQPWVRAI
jgi:hypothetical protein